MQGLVQRGYNFSEWNGDGIVANKEIAHELSEIGVILLMFLAGMEIELREMTKTGRAAWEAARCT